MLFRYMYTHYIYPPIPDRRFDWFAGWSDMDGNGEYGLTEQQAIDNLLYWTEYESSDLTPMTKVVYSAEWTGRAGWRPTVHFGWRSKTQLPLFMVWKLFYGNNGEVVHGIILLCIDDRTLPKIWSYLWPIRYELDRWFKKWVYDNSKCSVCKNDTYVYPINPLKRSYCHEHCPEHEYEHERGIGWCCQICGDPAPPDF